MNMPPRSPLAIVVAALSSVLIAPPARAAPDESQWSWNFGVEADRPSGWVRVRENEIVGTQLSISDDLGVNRRNGVRFDAVNRVNPRGAWQFSFASYDLEGTTTVSEPIFFNGAAIGVGTLRTTTTYTHFLQFDALYWRRFTTFQRGGGVWGGVGATMVLLNFRLEGTVVSALSEGSETQEDFDAQELPVPTLGFGIEFPLSDRWSLITNAVGGRLPLVDSLRTEGGTVRIEQTNAELSVGVGVQLHGGWRVSLSAFTGRFDQNEQSREDGNLIHLRNKGLVLSIGRPFGHSQGSYTGPPVPWAPS